MIFRRDFLRGLAVGILAPETVLAKESDVVRLVYFDDYAPFSYRRTDGVVGGHSGRLHERAVSGNGCSCITRGSAMGKGASHGTRRKSRWLLHSRHTQTS